MAQQVIFSERAYVALLTETLGKISTETGGIFLGHFDNDKWYIIESIDPGPKSVFSSVYFEYDESYVNHLVNKINILYKKPLQIMGLWHRHPGSMDYFSSTDNSTHKKYAYLNPFGVVSALVNIDPAFRITIYSISRNNGRLVIPNKKLSYDTGNKYIPNDFLSYNSIDLLAKKINSSSINNIERLKKNKLFESIIKKTFESNRDMIEIKNNNLASIPVLDDDIEKIIEVFEKDLDFFEKQGIICKMSRTEDKNLCFYGENEPGKKTGIVEIFIHNENIYIRHNNKTLHYNPGFFSAAIK